MWLACLSWLNRHTMNTGNKHNHVLIRFSSILSGLIYSVEVLILCTGKNGRLRSLLNSIPTLPVHFLKNDELAGSRRISQQ